MPFSGSQRPQAGLVRKSILSPRSSKALWPASIACSLLAGVLMASSACSTESGGRKTPLAGSPAPTVPPAGRPAAGDSRGDATGDAAQTQALEAARRAAVLSQSPPDGAAGTGQGAQTRQAAPVGDVAAPPADTSTPQQPNSMTHSSLAGSTMDTTTPATSTAGAMNTSSVTAPAPTHCTTGKTLDGPRYTTAHLNMRSGPSASASFLTVVPLHAEVAYYWTSGSYACVVWRGPTTHVGWISTAYMRLSKP